MTVKVTEHSFDSLWVYAGVMGSWYMSFAKTWHEKGCGSKAETWKVKLNILMKDFDWQVKFDAFVVPMATWTIEYNLKIVDIKFPH